MLLLLLFYSERDFEPPGRKGSLVSQTIIALGEICGFPVVEEEVSLFLDSKDWLWGDFFFFESESFITSWALVTSSIL